jgi:hypothetical protein
MTCIKYIADDDVEVSATSLGETFVGITGNFGGGTLTISQKIDEGAGFQEIDSKTAESVEALTFVRGSTIKYSLSGSLTPILYVCYADL